MTDVIDVFNERLCSLCGKETHHGFVFPFNPLRKKWYWKNDKYPIIWLCEKCQENNAEAIHQRKYLKVTKLK